MKPLSRFIKGILISLMLVMAMELCSGFLLPQSNLAGIPVAYAQDSGKEDEAQTLQDAKKFEDVVKGIELPKDAPKDAKDKDELIKKVASTANWTHRLFAPLINFFAFKIGAFLGTDYIFEGKMGDMLHKIWVISRNLVNIAFVFLLLFIALKEIFGVTGESNLGKNLIKFVLLLVAVNFSWLGTKVVLDAANVVTHIVFSIPSGITDPPTATKPDTKANTNNTAGNCKVNSYPEKPVEGTCYPTTIIAPADSGMTVPLYWQDKEGEEDFCAEAKKAYAKIYDKDGKKIKLEDNDPNKKLQGRTSICMENLNLVKYDQNTAVIYLTYGMARIQNLIRTVGTPKIDELAVSVLLSLVIQLAYTVSLLALFIALVIRMAALWFFVAFSPFIVLMLYFSGEGSDPFSDIRGKFDFSGFAKWAFVPAKVGAVFAVSFIMISAGQAIGEVDITAFDKIKSKSDFVFDIPQIESLFAGIGSLQQFIWLLMSLVVLWIGVFAVLKDMPIIGVITGHIESIGRTTAEKVAALPYRAPILPLGKGEDAKSFRDVVGGLDLRKRIDDYTGDHGSKSENVRKLNRSAGSSKAKEAVNSAKGRNFTFTPAQANQMAKAHGLELKKFIDTDHKVLKEALMKSGADDGEAGKIIEALEKANKQTPAELKNQANLQAMARARADREVGGNRPSGTATPGAPATGGGPRPPAPPAPRPPAPGGGA